MLKPLSIGCMLLSTSIAQADAICTQVGNAVVCNDLNTAQGQLSYGRAQSEATLARFNAPRPTLTAVDVSGFAPQAATAQKKNPKQKKPLLTFAELSSCTDVPDAQAKKVFPGAIAGTAKLCASDDKQVLICSQDWSLDQTGKHGPKAYCKPLKDVGVTTTAKVCVINSGAFVCAN